MKIFLQFSLNARELSLDCILKLVLYKECQDNELVDNRDLIYQCILEIPLANQSRCLRVGQLNREFF